MELSILNFEFSYFELYRAGFQHELDLSPSFCPRVKNQGQSPFRRSMRVCINIQCKQKAAFALQIVSFASGFGLFNQQSWHIQAASTARVWDYLQSLRTSGW